MLNLFKRPGKKNVAPTEERDVSPEAERARHKKPGQSTEFKGKALKAKLAVIEAIKNADKQRALESLVVLSDLAAQAIYEHDLRAMLIINLTIDEINHTIDARLKSLGEPSDLIEDMEETKMYLMIRLTMLPVCSMMNALQRFSTTGMDEVNNDIDSRIFQIRQFVMEHERSP
jgi:hypothetical protein